VADLKDKTIAAVEIGSFAGAMVQFYVMQQAGQDFVMGPERVVFTGTQVFLLCYFPFTLAWLISKRLNPSRSQSRGDC
jgi:hypothetical protein